MASSAPTAGPRRPPDGRPVSGLLVDRAAVAVALALAAAAGFVTEASTDFHWHVVLGRHVLGGAGIYTHDAHSYTFAGEPVFVSSWLSDTLLAAAFDLGGYFACFVLRALALVGVALLLSRDAVHRGVRPHTAAAMLVLFFGAQFADFSLRPETFGFFFFALTLAALGAHERTGKRTPLWILAAAILLWPNFHASVSIGLLAVGLYAAQMVLSELRRGERRDRRRLALGLALPPAAFFLTCLNPEGIALPLGVRVVSDVWVDTIREWLPLSLELLGPIGQVAALAAVLTTAAAVAVAGRTSPYLVVLVLVLGGLSAVFRRFLPFAMLAAIPLAATNLSALRALRERGRAHLWRRVGPLLAATAFLLGLGAASLHADELGVGVRESHASYPVRACRFLRSANVPGPVFNDYNFGSYLMFCLGKDFPLFIDQRAWSLYTDQFYRRLLAAERSRDELERLLADYPARWAVLKYQSLGVLVASLENWRVVHFDDKAMVLANANDPEAADVIAEHEFRYLHPLRVVQLPNLRPRYLDAARRELERLTERCPGCYRTDLARAGLAVAAGDDAGFRAARDRLLQRSESMELAFLAGRHAEERGEHLRAAAFFSRYVELGGDPVAGSIEAAESLHAAGQTGEAARLLERTARDHPRRREPLDRARQRLR